MCRYVSLNALNVLHVHGPRFNAPLLHATKYYSDFEAGLNQSCNLPESFLHTAQAFAWSTVNFLHDFGASFLKKVIEKESLPKK